MRKAGTSGQRAMRAEAKRRIRAAKNLRAKIVNQSLTVRRETRGGADGMSWALLLDGRPISLIAYKARQIRRGVSVSVNKGKRTVLRGAFIQRMPNGHRAVFVRRGNTRLPIDEKLGSRPVDVLLKNGQSEAVAQRGADVARRAFVRLLPFEIDKINATG